VADSASASLPVPQPEAYLLTFACYGARLHGDPRGSVDRHNNAFGGRLLAEDPDRYGKEGSRMLAGGYQLDEPSRSIVLDAIREVCSHESWTLHAAHIRSTHAHVVVSAPGPPERVLGKLKAYASRALNRSEGSVRKRWARHGSTVYLWQWGHVFDAVEYTHLRQGAPMARYLHPTLLPHFR
jgi:REP element-mobilizing transposase RayT